MITIMFISGRYFGDGVFDTVTEDHLVSEEALAELLSETEWCSETGSWRFLESDERFIVK